MLTPPADYSKTQIDPLNDIDGDKINLSELIDALVDNKWLIIAITFITLSLGVIKTFLDTPVYAADGLLQIKESSGLMAGLEDLTGQTDTDTKSSVLTETEIELINSRSILGEAVNNLHLDIIAKPKYFPVIGEAIAGRFPKRHQNDVISSPSFGQSHYAWGGEAIQVDTFTVPPDLEGKEFILQAGKNGQFKLIYDGEILLEGKVGKLVSKQLGSNARSVAIFVSLLKSHPDTYFTVVRRPEIQAIRELRSNLLLVEKSKGTGMLQMVVEAHSQDLAVSIWNEIANIYVRKDVDRKSAESQKSLEFLENQLLILKEQMDVATTAMNDYRIRQGSVDLNLETQNILQGAVELKTQMTLLQQKRDELRQKYTKSHPTIVSIDKQIARLQEQASSQDKKIEILPETQQVLLRLSSDINVSAELYNNLLNSAQTLRVARAGAVGDVRIVDHAILPGAPIKPRKALIIVIALVLGLILGIAVVFIRRLLKHGIDDPDLIGKGLNMPVYATIPHSRRQKILNSKFKNIHLSNDNPPAIFLALVNKEDIAIESLRSLRNTLHFAFLLEARSNIIMIGGPSPGDGKTFVSINLAAVMADAGKKTLLIDGDLRRGAINKDLGVNREHGLSELILNTIKIDDAIHRIALANFDFISTGSFPPNPSELLLHENFAIFLENISKQYDLVIIDSSPISAVNDATIIARLASATLMVIKAGAHPMGELEQCKKRFIQAGANLKGIVFNDVPQLSSRPATGQPHVSPQRLNRMTTGLDNHPEKLPVKKLY